MKKIRDTLKIWLSLVCLAALLTGCALSAPPAAPQPGPKAVPAVQEVSMLEAMQAWRDKTALFVDVRTPEEYREGHAPGAVLIPLAELAARQAEVPRDRKVLLICRSGSRSAQANLLLQQQGLTNTASVRGGMTDWREAVER